MIPIIRQVPRPPRNKTLTCVNNPCSRHNSEPTVVTGINQPFGSLGCSTRPTNIGGLGAVMEDTLETWHGGVPMIHQICSHFRFTSGTGGLEEDPAFGELFGWSSHVWQAYVPPIAGGTGIFPGFQPEGFWPENWSRFGTALGFGFVASGLGFPFPSWFLSMADFTVIGQPVFPHKLLSELLLICGWSVIQSDDWHTSISH